MPTLGHSWWLWKMALDGEWGGEFYCLRVPICVAAAFAFLLLVAFILAVSFGLLFYGMFCASVVLFCLLSFSSVL